MATVEQLEAALRKADAAGNVEDARQLANAIRSMRTAPAAAPPKPSFGGVTGTVRGSAPVEKGLLRRSAENLVGESGANTLDAFQHHAMNALHGGAQLIEHGLSSVADRYLDADNPIRQSLTSAVAQDDAAIKAREQAYQARVPDGGAAYGGAAVGEVLPWMTGVSALKAVGVLPKLKAVSEVPTLAGKAGNLAAKTGLLGAEGTLMGLLSPVTGEGEYAGQKGAQALVGAVTAPLLAGGLSGLAKGAGGLSGLLRYLTPAGRETIANNRLAKLFGADEATISQLRTGTDVPGFTLTPAQALGTPEAVQAERALRNNGATAPFFAAQESANNAALRDQAARVAKTPEDEAAAKAARTAATAPYYEQLKGARVDPAPILQALDSLANSSMGVLPKVKAAAASIRAEITGRTGPDGKMDAEVLSGLHENAGSFLGDMVKPKEKLALGPLKDSIVDTLDGAVPGYRANNAAWATASQPLTDMAAGRAFVSAIDSGGRDAGGNPTVSLNAIKSILAKDDKAKYKMSPQARAQLQAMLDAAQKRSISNNTIAASGPGTAADALRGAGNSPLAQRLLGQLAAGAGFAGGGLPGYLAAAALTEGGIAANKAVVRKMGQKAASSEETAKALEAVLRKKQKPPLLPNGMPEFLLPYIVQ